MLIVMAITLIASVGFATESQKILSKAKWNYGKGNYETALELLKSSVAQVKDKKLQSQFYTNLAKCYLKLKNPKEAKKAIDMTGAEKTPAISLVKGKVLVALKQYKQAETELKYAMTKSPQYIHGRAYFTLAMLYKNTGKIDRHDEMMSEEALAKLHPSTRDNVYIEAMWHSLENKDFKTLAQNYEKFTKACDGRADWGISITRLELGRRMNKNGKDDKLALRIWQDLANSKLKKPCPASWIPEANLHCRNILLRNGKAQKAKAAYEKCLKDSNCNKHIKEKAKQNIKALAYK